MRKVAIIIILFSLAPSILQPYILKSYVIESGGLSKINSNSYILGGSISQSLAGKLTNNNYNAYIGYWTPGNAPPGIEEFEQSHGLKHPIIFSLNQNYPNPVSHKTIIRYSISKNCKVELKLYDITGRKVANLVNENQKSGYYQVTWNIQNVSSKELADGIYFYQLSTGDFIQTKKMIILR